MAFLRMQGEKNEYYDITLESNRISIGREGDNDVILNEPTVSKYHARLNFENDYFLTDLRSANGTYINGRKILHNKLTDGDVINFAGFNVTFFE